MFDDGESGYLSADGNSTAATLLPVPFAMSTLAPALPQIRSYGHDLDMDEDKIGLLRDSSDAENDFKELRRRFDEDGYLYIMATSVVRMCSKPAARSLIAWPP